jgi:DNA polymerase III delta subunit
MDVVDSGRAVSFFLSSWRILAVEIPPSKAERLSKTDENIIRDYLHSPPARTVLVLVLAARLKKNNPLYKLFSSFSSSVVHMSQLRPLKEGQIISWIDKRLSEQEKNATHEAKKRLLELTGNDLGRISNELEKIITFVGPKTLVEADDVNQVSGWVKSFYEWEITDNLEKGNYAMCLAALHKLLNQEGAKPEYILGLLAKFFRDILQAKLWLKEGSKNKKAIFKHLRPQIQEKFGNFYTRKFNEFFALVGRMGMTELNAYLTRLKNIDLKIKTSDFSPQIMLEGFLFEFCKGR